MQIVWHGHYVKYLEMARCAFLSAIQYDYREMGVQGFSWPIVQLHVKYVKPAVFGQKNSGGFGGGGDRKLFADRLHLC